MNPHDFVFKSIYDGAIRKGTTKKAAEDQAEMGLENFKKGSFKKAINLIEEHIKLAVAQSDDKKKLASKNKR